MPSKFIYIKKVIFFLTSFYGSV